jgi:Asp-tRNA(Asn)/Glu-tRNA(Gln) amidotransferase C subunit
MVDFTQEIKRLQKLSCIALSPEQEQKLWAQLSDIIGFLGQLPEPKLRIENWRVHEGGKLKIAEEKLTLRTIAGAKESLDSKKILQNVKHPIINNSIVIKSVLS